MVKLNLDPTILLATTLGPITANGSMRAVADNPEALGLEPEGMVRVGFLHYNTRDEVDRLVEAVSTVP